MIFFVNYDCVEFTKNTFTVIGIKALYCLTSHIHLNYQKIQTYELRQLKLEPEQNIYLCNI